MATMSAVVYDKKSLPDKLRYSKVEKPVPNDNEALIKILAVSVNAADYRSMNMGLIPKKKIFGADIAGRIESVGKNISQFKVGDEVIGELSACGFGGFAEYAVAPEKVLIHKPANILFEEAAAIPMAAVTALQGLRNKGKIQKGQNVLIVGSSGGVGTFAVQLAKFFEAEVTAVCSTKNVEQAIVLGADFVVDYKNEDFTKTKKTYDLILAVNGNHSLFSYKRLLKTGGRYVMIGGALKQIFQSLLFERAMSLGSKKMLSLAAKTNKNDMEFIAQLVHDGKIKAVIEKYFPFENTIEAMRYIKDGHAKGKVVIKME